MKGKWIYVSELESKWVMGCCVCDESNSGKSYGIWYGSICINVNIEKKRLVW